jgi:hypothetical protein
MQGEGIEEKLAIVCWTGFRFCSRPLTGKGRDPRLASSAPNGVATLQVEESTSTVPDLLGSLRQISGNDSLMTDDTRSGRVRRRAR